MDLLNNLICSVHFFVVFAILGCVRLKTNLYVLKQVLPFVYVYQTRELDYYTHLNIQFIHEAK